VLKHLIVLFSVFFFIPVSFAANRVPNSEDPYEVLGVDPTVSDDTLTSVWKKLVKSTHPDAGGSVEDAQTVNEAYQFLKKNREFYDRGLLPFNGQFKKAETRPVPLSVEEEARFQWLYRTYFLNLQRARERYGAFAEKKPVFLLYATLKASGESGRYDREYRSYELRAYRELLTQLGILSLTKFELNGILLRDPVEALDKLLEHFDNFNVRLSTIGELFAAYKSFYLTERDRTEALLELIQRLRANGILEDRRYEAIRSMALDSLLTWLAAYQDASRSNRRNYKDQYRQVRRLVLSMVSLRRQAQICVRLLIGHNP